MTPSEGELCTFAVKRGELLNKEIYCNPTYPYYLKLINSYKASKYNCGVMSDFLFVNPKTDCSALLDNDNVSFVPMTNVQEKNNIVSYDIVPYKQVKKGFTVFSKGDLIWAKITPCMQNGKSCSTENMPTEIGFGSTEFHIIRRKSDNIYMPFIWAIFSNDNVLAAAQAVFSGSAGQQRISASFIERFPAVIPSYDMQVKMVAELEQALSNKNQKVQKANELRISFEQNISQKFGLRKKGKKELCFAVKYSQIDGVIDVKRYSSQKSKVFDLSINDVCDIVESKVNATTYGTDIIDWIRIDDLPNQPLDIEEIRTQPASEVDGSFFEVKENDILVARLGPTILNQKIVMVHSLKRITIASSEFLVLRCKNGYNPEAVMAVLKTAYYKDLMYSHSRGSTPSRYRLNREDMLKLPFPDIKEFQKELSKEAKYVREKVKDMRIQAETAWQEAKEQFEKELLGE